MIRQEPAVSILLPAYDAEATLAACLRSVQRQTDGDWECIVVDDGSSDGTAALAARFAARDPQIRLERRSRQGLVAALNHGLTLCRADLVARMDADDVMLRRRVELQRRALESNPHDAAVGCHVRMFPRAILRDGSRNYEAWLNGLRSPDEIHRDLFVECPVAHPALMIRRSCLERLGGYRDMGWPEDYDLLLRLAAAGLRIDTVLAWGTAEVG